MDRVFSSPHPAPESGIAVLLIDGLKLLLPQNTIHALEPVLDVEAGADASDAAGWIAYQGQQWPVYCLAKDLTALPDIPASRRVCVILNAAQGYFCLVCDNVQMLDGRQVEMTALPVCMKSTRSPFHYLAVLDEGIGCVTAVDRLAAFVERSNTDDPLVPDLVDESRVHSGWGST